MWEPDEVCLLVPRSNWKLQSVVRLLWGEAAELCWLSCSLYLMWETQDRSVSIQQTRELLSLRRIRGSVRSFILQRLFGRLWTPEAIFTSAVVVFLFSSWPPCGFLSVWLLSGLRGDPCSPVGSSPELSTDRKHEEDFRRSPSDELISVNDRFYRCGREEVLRKLLEEHSSIIRRVIDSFNGLSSL